MQHTFQLTDYPVFLAPLEETLPAWLRKHDYSQIFMVTDENVRQYCLSVFLQKAGLPASVPLVVIPAGEWHKNLSAGEQIWQAMFNARLDRKALVINLGGGVIGDMGGFCAATFKRGVDFIQVPTTLLAMTDAAIGGKLGVDFQGIKNAVGVFRNPAAVFADPLFLQTLPPRELRSGFAEVIKHALIGDPVLWEKIRNIPAGRLGAGNADWSDLLHASIAVKVRVVTEDPLEKGIRALLNFGHTIGHAIESYFLNTDDPLTHGEAVAIGMVCETPPPTPPETPPPTPPLKGRGDVTPSTSPLPFRGGV
ncbi:MAG: 3-dehydroquinate synthase, partial [Thermoanaerobaculia bacterium]|nr:3-dehydroquinate synthase [Thermoanaerobaculia bacterium]